MLAVVPRSARGAVCRLGSRTVLEGRDAVLDIRRYGVGGREPKWQASRTRLDVMCVLSKLIVDSLALPIATDAVMFGTRSSISTW